MDTQVMAGHFIGFYHRGLVWNIPTHLYVFLGITLDLVKQAEIISFMKSTPNRSKLQLDLFFF